MPKLYSKIPEAEQRKGFIRVQQEGDYIAADIVDQHGKDWVGAHLFTIRPEGVLYLERSVNAIAAEAAGIKLDSDGRMQVGR